MTLPRRLRQVEKWLRHEFPFRGKVRIRIEQIDKDEDGHCVLEDDGSYTIKIHPSSPIKIETLLHEWAHLGVRRMCHGKAWGARFQQIYQQWHDRGGKERSKLL